MRVNHRHKLGVQSVACHYLNSGSNHSSTTGKVVGAATNVVCYTNSVVWTVPRLRRCSPGEEGKVQLPSTHRRHNALRRQGHLNQSSSKFGSRRHRCSRNSNRHWSNRVTIDNRHHSSRSTSNCRRRRRSRVPTTTALTDTVSIFLKCALTCAPTVRFWGLFSLAPPIVRN